MNNLTQPNACKYLFGLIFLPLTVTALYGDEIPTCKLAARWRSALGFDGPQMAALGVNSETLQSIVAQAESYCSQNRGTVEPLLAAIQSARQNRFRAYELGTATNDDDQTLLNAISALAEVSSTPISTLKQYLSTPQQSLFDRIAANRLLDPALAIIDLTSQQRSDLRSAQRTRDLTLKHHRNRKDLVACKSASDTFNVAVATALTDDQETEYETNQTNASNHFGANLTVEEQVCAN